MDHVLRIVQEQIFYVKLSKYEFNMIKILYLEHITSHEGVNIDKKKIATIKE